MPFFDHDSAGRAQRYRHVTPGQVGYRRRPDRDHRRITNRHRKRADHQLGVLEAGAD
jgi:hypothetical protein